MNTNEAIESLNLKFTSGNSVPIDRALIKREEYDAIKYLFERNSLLTGIDPFSNKQYTVYGTTSSINILSNYINKLEELNWNPMRMHNPAHPGEILKACMGNITVTEMAKNLHCTRANLSRIINGKNGISASMALALEDYFTVISAKCWLSLQMNYDLWVASQKK